MKAFKRLVIPHGVFMVVFIAFPMLLIALYAFTKKGNDIVTIQFTLDNFIRFFDPVFINILIQSLKIALITTIFCLLMGYPIAYFITKQGECSQMLLILLITMPMWVNMLIRTYSWISLLSTNGIINNILVMLGFNRIEMLYTDFAVILGMVYNYLPFMIISIHTQLAKMDQSIIQASYDLGANWKQTFSKVIFPLSIPGVMTGITLVFLPAVSSFVIPKLLGGGSYMLIGNLIENQFGSAGNWNFGSAISLIMTVIIIVTMAITKHFDKDVEDKNSKGARQW
ncbi:MAG: ABC transporter permease [Erysipelothrix sp.]|nr:ABC transporter permease [Erysipelothrix sp.]